LTVTISIRRGSQWPPFKNVPLSKAHFLSLSVDFVFQFPSLFVRLLIFWTTHGLIIGWDTQKWKKEMYSWGAFISSVKTVW
jgi:hypothetical protein